MTISIHYPVTDTPVHSEKNGEIVFYSVRLTSDVDANLRQYAQASGMPVEKAILMTALYGLERMDPLEWTPGEPVDGEGPISAPTFERAIPWTHAEQARFVEFARVSHTTPRVVLRNAIANGLHAFAEEAAGRPRSGARRVRRSA